MMQIILFRFVLLIDSSSLHAFRSHHNFVELEHFEGDADVCLICGVL